VYGKGTEANILATSQFNKSQFTTLNKGIKDLVNQAKATQRKINKENGTKGKAVFRTEQLVVSPETGKNGTIDLLVLFSDNSAAVYDYKFVSPSVDGGYVKVVNGEHRIVNDPFTVKMDTYNIQIGAYKDTLLNKYGVTRVRHSRIVPIHVRFEYKKEG